MMSLTMFLVTLLAVLGITTGQVFRRKCPDVKTKPDFNITRYLGDWYEDRKFLALFELGLKCVKANYQLLDNGNIRVTNTGIRRVIGTRTVGRAEATLQDDEPGRLTIRFNPDSPPGRYLVLATDYDNYALVYTCQRFLGFFSTEIAWILKRRRDYELPATDERRLYAKLEMYKINSKRFRKANQRSCPN